MRPISSGLPTTRSCIFGISERSSAHGSYILTPELSPDWNLAEVDVIVIGAGQNGLTLAAYLAKAGLEVAVLERRNETGGGLCTEEVMIPGFWHNLHSNFHLWKDFAPAWSDLEFERYGMRYIRPEVQWGAPLSDGKCLYIHTDPSKTHNSFAEFSKKDADTFSRIKREVDPMFWRLMRELYYKPPPTSSDGEPAAIRMEKSLSFFDPKWLEMTPFEVADALFENEAIKTFILANIWFAGWAPDNAGFGDYVPFFAGICDHTYLAEGGSHKVAHTLTRFINAHGGRILELADVRRIIVKDNVAKGVELSPNSTFPDRTISARKCVVSAVDVTQTFQDLVGEEHVDPGLMRKIREFRYSGNCLFTVHMALKEPPSHTAAKSDPTIDRAWSQNIGYESYDDLKEHINEISSGNLPKTPRFEAACNTLFDRTQAPPNHHTAIIWQEVPAIPNFQGDASTMAAAKESYAEQCIQTWRNYAPNLDARNIIASFAYTPFDYGQKLISMRTGNWALGSMDAGQWWTNRPLPELSQYRTPIKNLYLCSSSCHPGGSIFLAAGYNAANIIAEDLGIQKWWPPETSGGPTQVV